MLESFFFDCQPAGLDEVLRNREQRAERRRTLQEQYRSPVIALTLNIPGQYKAFPLAEMTFMEAVAWINTRLVTARVPVLAYRQYAANTGCEGLWAVDCGAKQIKVLMMDIENWHPMARLLDIDVFAPTGEKLSRVSFGEDGRICFLCKNLAFSCAKNGAHPIEILQAHAIDLMKSYFHQKTEDRIATLAVNSLLDELLTTPKPGLVDRNNQGSHKDMDIFTLTASAVSLYPFFSYCAAKGLERQDISPERLFQELRFAGMCAEQNMRGATGGINTHKGAIMALGILSAAAGYLYRLDIAFDAEKLLSLAGEMSHDVLLSELRGIESGSGFLSNGEQQYRLSGSMGARGEIANGFPSVRNIALPVYHNLLNQGLTKERAGTITLLHLMAYVEDSNIAARSSVEYRSALQSQLRIFLKNAPIPSEEEIAGWDRLLIKENVSPGGCADLLAVTYFIAGIIKKPLLYH